MNAPNAHEADEVGEAIGPQGAAQEALGVEIDGKEGDAGGPGAAQQESAGPSEQTWAEILRPLFGTGFKLASLRWPKMAADPAEIEALVEVWSPVCEKHCGGSIPIEYVAVGTAVLIVGPKILASVTEARREKAEQSAGHEPGGPTTNTP